MESLPNEIIYNIHQYLSYHDCSQLFRINKQMYYCTPDWLKIHKRMFADVISTINKIKYKINDNNDNNNNNDNGNNNDCLSYRIINDGIIGVRNKVTKYNNYYDNITLNFQIVPYAAISDSLHINSNTCWKCDLSSDKWVLQSNLIADEYEKWSDTDTSDIAGLKHLNTKVEPFHGVKIILGSLASAYSHARTDNSDSDDGTEYVTILISKLKRNYLAEDDFIIARDKFIAKCKYKNKKRNMRRRKYNKH